MSPYAEYPKTPQAQDWGRETIEMQENGSTKNLLQMTDVYYMVMDPYFSKLTLEVWKGCRLCWDASPVSCPCDHLARYASPCDHLA